MTDPFRDDYTYLTELPEELRDRRRAAARRRRWRRRLVIAGLVAVVAAVVAIAVASYGGGGSDDEGERSEPAAQAPGVTPSYPTDWEAHPGPVPILSYHAIQPPVAGATDPQSFVPQSDLQRQMAWLDDQGYEAVTLDQVETSWYEDGKLPPKPIVISFDGGYLSQYVAGFLVLQKHRWPGVLNIAAQGADLPDADIQRMIDAHWELASAAVTNVDLTTVGPTQLEREVAGSREQLSDRFGVSVDNFSYPDGSYDDAVISAVRSAGYVAAQSETPGLATADDPFTLNRIEIQLDDGLRGFIEKLSSVGAA